jgi:phage terminase large subunit
VFQPLLEPARYKGAWGGRGSGKSHFFAELMVETAVRKPGFRAVCVREVQKSLAGSSHQLIADKVQALGVGHLFDVQKDRVVTPGGGAILFQGMQNHTAESVKSLEGMDVAWVEEAQALGERSLSLLDPTIRKEGSELWFSWNPTRKSDAVDKLLRQLKPDNAIVIRANWRDNPWFTGPLHAVRQKDYNLYPERYEHIWEGAYATAFEGAYFARALTQAKNEGRIGHVAADPLLRKRAYFDIGGAGARADAMAIWVCQFVGREIRVLDYLEGQGQVLAHYVGELRSRGYGDVLCVLPHDGANTNNVTGKRYADHLADAGFEVETIPNQGSGAAAMRIEAVRRIFPQVWFDASATEAGRDALGFYHEKRDEERNIGLGPEHDWSSHAADAFGLMAIAYELPQERKALRPGSRRPGGWMAA